MRGVLYTTSVATLLLLSACSREAQHSSTERAEEALNLITIDRLEDHLGYLADDERQGRESGQPGYDDAANYVAEQLSRMGVEPGGNDGWYQPVRLRSFKIDTEKARVTLHRDGRNEDLRYRDDFAMTGDAVRDSTSVRAEVVYVGFGVHAPELGYSDYEGIDVRGKIVARFGGAPESIEGSERAYYASSRTKAEEAVSRGAVGTIALRTRKAEERRSWEKSKKNFGKKPQMTWLSRDGRAAAYYPELKGSAVLSMELTEKLFDISPLSYLQAIEAVDASRPASAALGLEVTMSRQTEHSSVESPNVIGVVRGTDPDVADEYVAYTAHLDHVGVIGDDEDNIHNGAYDNAMGVALMLETARAIAAAPPKRSVMFIALTAEERGLLGSDFFANNPTVPIESIVANINLDMPLFLYPVADLVAFGSQHSSLHSVTEDAASAEGFVFSPDPLPEENLFVRSDQYSFVRQGIPAIYLIPGFISTDEDIDGEALFRDHLKNHYHEPSDDLERPIDWDSALRFARAHTRMGYTIADSDRRPSWNEGDFFGLRYSRQ